MNTDDQLPNIDKIFQNEDEDFVPGSGNNLAAIFGSRVSDQDTHSLTKSVNQRKYNSIREVSQTQTSDKAEVIIAKAVHAYKLQNGQYVSVGKLGMALTGNVSKKVYQIILYKGKQEYISVVTVTSKFTYIVQANNYSTYYDSNNENWSILFENNEASVEFSREIGLARYFSKEEKMTDVIYQDLTVINKDKVAKEGDNVSVKYCISTDIVQPYKTNSTVLQTTVEISADDNWERTLLETSKGLKRILFVPSSKQISLGPGFPKGKDIMMEIEVTNIQPPEETHSTSKPVLSSKASLLSRMAKMGQSILPKLPTSTTTDSEDTEDDAPQKSPRHKKVELSDGQKKQMIQETSDESSGNNMRKIVKSRSEVPSSTPAFSKPLVAAPAFTSTWMPAQIQSNYVTVDGQVYPMQSPTISQTVPAIIDPSLNLLLSETRMANTEIRMGMSKISDNVQKLLEKFHILELQNATSTTKDGTMEETLKLLLSMNASQSVIKNSELIKRANENVSNEDSTVHTEAKQKINELENELAESKELLKSKIDYIDTLEMEKETLSRRNEKLNKKIQELEFSLQNVNKMLQDKTKDLEMTKNLEIQCTKENAELQSKIFKLTSEHTAFKSNTLLSKQKDRESQNREIKNIMNKIYLSLVEIFTDEFYDTDFIKSTIASTIKNVTLQVLHETSEKNKEKIEQENITENNSITTTENNSANEKPSESSSNTNLTSSFSTDFIMVQVLQDEPPPIPPIDKEFDNDSIY